jgi:hypothetical protein
MGMHILNHHGKRFGLAVASALILIWADAQQAGALERLTLRTDGHCQAVAGKVLVEAQDGGVMLLARDGKIWMAQPAQLERRQSDDVPFEPWDKAEIADRLLEEMPEGFQIHDTAHYVICYNTSEAYAEWCGGLFERLYRAFYRFWETRGLSLTEPQFPLIALIFADQASYAEYSRRELGTPATAIIGYYNMQSNRVTMYDLTGADALRHYQRRFTSAAHINQILSQPAAERTVATIVHEATHQLAYNSGLQTRFADNPFWVSEGIAMFFEVPDLNSSRGWRNIGSINQVHLARFRRTLPNRPADTLVKLLSQDDLFRNARQARDAYAQAWALTYYLVRARRRDFAAYLEDLAALPPLSEEGSEARIARFKRYFGDDLQEFDQEFLRYMRRLR